MPVGPSPPKMPLQDRAGLPGPPREALIRASLGLPWLSAFLPLAFKIASFRVSSRVRDRSGQELHVPGTWGELAEAAQSTWGAEGICPQPGRGEEGPLSPSLSPWAPVEVAMTLPPALFSCPLSVGWTPQAQ